MPDQTPGTDPNPFEPTCILCGDTGFAVALECGPMEMGRLLDIGEPGKPGPDLRFKKIKCTECQI